MRKEQAPRTVKTNVDVEAVAERIRNSTVEAVLRIACPSCNGPLRVQVTTRKSPSMSVLCLGCPWRVVFDGMDRPPVWVDTLGYKITTVSKQPPANVKPAAAKEDAKGEPLMPRRGAKGVK